MGGMALCLVPKFAPLKAGLSTSGQDNKLEIEAAAEIGPSMLP